jgi:hypothetical protein
MRDRLKADLYHMIEDHKEIVAALNNLMETAKPHNKTEEELYSLKKTLDAKTDEQVLYPSTILVGEYLRLKLYEI